LSGRKRGEGGFQKLSGKKRGRNVTNPRRVTTPRHLRRVPNTSRWKGVTKHFLSIKAGKAGRGKN